MQWRGIVWRRQNAPCTKFRAFSDSAPRGAGPGGGGGGGPPGGGGGGGKWGRGGAGGGGAGGAGAWEAPGRECDRLVTPVVSSSPVLADALECRTVTAIRGTVIAKALILA